MLTGINAFLSEESIKLHREHLETLRIKYSVFEACNKHLLGKNIKDINKIKLLCDKEELLNLKEQIVCHELFFDSFAEKYKISRMIKQKYGNESGFLYDVYRKGVLLDCGYIILYKYKNIIDVFFGKEVREVFLKTEPILCIDMYEHSYFNDYGFHREEYVENALSYWNLTKADKFFYSKD